MRLVASLTLAFTLLASPALAAELRHPEPGAYVDADHQARVRVGQLEDQARFEALRRHALRGQLRADGLAALGYAYALRGEAEDARAMLALAREYAGQRSALLRHVLWSSGWAHLNLGDYEAAAEAWQASADLHGGRPFWLPYSMAVLAELRGERELAIQWYDAAARSQLRWSHAEGVARATYFWQRKESAAIDRVFHAWQASKPLQTHGLSRESES